MMYVLANAHWFALLLGGLIFFHEFGHFAVAKACGVKVLAFSMGFGPRLLSFTRGETLYSLSLLPLGGYVRMLGEGPGAEVLEHEQHRAFASKPLWQRTAIVLAGPVANFLVAFVVYVVMFTGPKTFGAAKLGMVVADQPGAQAGLQPGDELVSLDGLAVERWAQVHDIISEHPGRATDVTYRRGGVEKTVTMTPAATASKTLFNEQEQVGRAGISLQYQRPIVAIVDVESPAAQAGVLSGDRIVAIDDQATEAWWQVKEAVAARARHAQFTATLVRGGDTFKKTIVPSAMPKGLGEAVAALSGSADAGPERYTGLVNSETIIAAVDADGPAALAGVRVGDRLVGLDVGATPGRTAEHRAVNVWLLDLMSLEPEVAVGGMDWVLQRGNKQITAHILPRREVEIDGMKTEHAVYRVGAENDPSILSAYSFTRSVGLIEASRESIKQVGDDMLLIVRGIGKMVQRKVPASNMGGPIMLFRLAEQSAKQGPEAFGRTLAVVSVNLGTLNLFPIPVLDGGHLIFFAYEALCRRAPSLRVREVAQTVGIALLLMLMVLVFKNDVVRFIAF